MISLRAELLSLPWDWHLRERWLALLLLLLLLLATVSLPSGPGMPVVPLLRWGWLGPIGSY